MNDLKFGFRQLLKYPGFTSVGALTLALGIPWITAVRGAESAQASEWITGSPEEVGLDSAALSGMFDFVREHNVPVHSVQIVRHGRLVLDGYFYPNPSANCRQSPHAFPVRPSNYPRTLSVSAR